MRTGTLQLICMKKIFLIPFLLFFFGNVCAQELEGAWLLTHKDGKEITDRKLVKIYQDGYFAYASKEINTNKFLSAAGGNYRLEGNSYSEIHDFNTMDTSTIGKESLYIFSIKGNILKITNKNTSESWNRISDTTDDLTQNWVITGRERNREMNIITPGDRRTIKILSGGHFQWIAFNSDTNEFSGTGGGTYSANNGVYIENIEFFSRDSSRVGASLKFEFEVKDGKWHHRGRSSKGDPIYEIWSPYRMFLVQ